MAQVGYVVSLLSLGMGHNRLTSLPAEVALLTRLTWLGLDGNPLILPTARQPPLLALQPPPPLATLLWAPTARLARRFELAGALYARRRLPLRLNLSRAFPMPTGLSLGPAAGCATWRRRPSVPRGSSATLRTSRPAPPPRRPPPPAPPLALLPPQRRPPPPRPPFRRQSRAIENS